MSEYLKFDKSNCKHCYKCIRECPVKSIKFSDNQANVISNECILCGNCFVICPQNAKEIRNDTKKLKEILAGETPVIASLAPSFVANYNKSTILSMKNALKKLGFYDVEETAIGATIVKKQYEELTINKTSNIIISSCCHSVNMLIQKYYPAALKYLANVLSPMQAHCVDIKKRFPGAKTVFIGPCIAKKEEAESYSGITDCVITFDELNFLLDENNISIEYIEDNNNESLARFFPVTGGILKTMTNRSSDYTYLAIDGVENCKNALEDIINGKINNCFIEMSACIGSCIGGPVMSKADRTPVSDYITVSDYAGKNDFVVTKYSENELAKAYKTLEPSHIIFSESAISEILKKIGKTKPEHELNCGGCGYNTCRDKAIAVLEGKANLNMCLPFLKEKAESFSDNIIKSTPNAIIVLNDSYEVQQINASACKMFNINNPRDVIDDQVVNILDPLPFMEVYQKGRNIFDKTVYLAEYQKYVNQTIIFDKSYNIFICIMRDVTDESNQRKQKEAISRTTMEIADKVIEKQMRAVQEIASLLGETTAETKVALTKLKESLRDEKLLY